MGYGKWDMGIRGTSFATSRMNSPGNSHYQSGALSLFRKSPVVMQGITNLSFGVSGAQTHSLEPNISTVLLLLPLLLLILLILLSDYKMPYQWIANFEIGPFF